MQLPPALRHRDFGLFWGGLVLSALGSQFTQVAMLWQIYELTGSPLQTGLLGLARAVPQMALMLFGGLLADAVDRRKLLMATQVAQFLVSAVLTALTVAGLVTPQALYVASAALALFTALETPTRNAIVPNLVPRDDVASAMALNSTQRQLGNIVGPPVAGILIAFSGPAWCYLVDTLSWLAMLGTLALVRTVTQTASGGRGRVGLRSIVDGITFVRDNPILLYMMLLDFGANLFGNNRALFPMYAVDILGVGAPGLGLMFTATAVGAIVSGAVMSLLPPMRRAGVWVLAGIAFYAVCLCVFAVSPYFWLSLLMLAGTGIGNSVSTVLRMTITQLSTPDNLRGRVSAVNGLFTQGGPQLGQFQTGAIAEFAGPAAACLFGGLATLAIAIGAYASPRIRTYANPALAEPTGAAPTRP